MHGNEEKSNLDTRLKCAPHRHQQHHHYHIQHRTRVDTKSVCFFV